MSRTLGRRLVALLIFAATGAQAGSYLPPPMPPGYDNPGPRPQNVLPQILNKLRGELRDPYSIRDFILCEPAKAKVFTPTDRRETWMPAHWWVMFALNAKNAYGGYIGRQRWQATFSNGVVNRLTIDQTGIGGTPLDVTLNRLMEQELDEKCQRVPDAEIQSALAG